MSDFCEERAPIRDGCFFPGVIRSACDSDIGFFFIIPIRNHRGEIALDLYVVVAEPIVRIRVRFYSMMRTINTTHDLESSRFDCGCYDLYCMHSLFSMRKSSFFFLLPCFQSVNKSLHANGRYSHSPFENFLFTQIRHADAITPEDCFLKLRNILNMLH